MSGTGALREEQQERQREKYGIEDPAAKPKNIPEELWQRMSPEFQNTVRNSNQTYSAAAIRRHLDARENPNG